MFLIKNFKILTFLVGLFSFLGNNAIAQVETPVSFQFSVERVSDTEFDLISTATLQKNWSIYSQYLSNDDGPIRTVFTYKIPAQYQLVGKTKEVSDHRVEGFDKLFDMNVIKFKESVRFVQRVKAADGARSSFVTGSVRYGTCDDATCLPPEDVDFSFRLIPDVAPAPAPEKPAQNNSNNDGSGASIEKIPPTPTSRPSQPLPNQRVNAHAPNTPPPPSIGGKNDVPKVVTVQNTVIQPSTIQNPAKYNFSLQKISETEFDIVAKLEIAEGYHTYSQTVKDGGPNPTEIKIENAQAVGKAREESAHQHDRFDKFFSMQLVDFEKEVSFIQRIKLADATQKTVKGLISAQFCDATSCFPPDEVPFEFDLKTGMLLGEAASTADANTSELFAKGYIDATHANDSCGDVVAEEEDFSSLWKIFFAGFLGGLAAFFMPCIFPLVPMTVGFFTKKSGNAKRNALLYGLSIVGIYTVFGVLITAIFGVETLNQLSTNAWFNIAMFLLLIAFGLSFFGYFELTLPSSWSTKTDALAESGGFLGIFFMAATLALVSFSCTGPIIGSLLAQAFQGGYVGPIVGMLGFSMALALPFMLFSAFPSWLQSLPRSGNWMNEFKVTIGFLEIALAFKFLSVADMTMGWKILPYELMLAVWILCAIGLVLYWRGRLRFPHDAPLREKVAQFSPKRWAMIGISLLTTVYLTFGFRHNNQSGTFQTPELASGLLPPAGHSYIYPKECPLNLNCFHDFEEGLAYAKSVKKPILLDFTGYGCVNCRKMEDYVWNKPGVFETIRDKYVLISLYTDDRKALAQAYTSAFDNKTKKTVGQKWSDFEVTHFNKNSQPYYVLLSDDRKILTKSVGSTDVKNYKNFLECGLKKYNSLKN